MKDDILSKIKAIRRNAEEALGFPLPAAAWARIDDEYEISYRPGQYDGDPTEASLFVCEYQAVIQRHIATLKEVVPLIARQLGVMANTISDKPKRTRKISRRPFERRVYLYDFILQAKGIDKRANWPAIAEEWNRQHPNDPQSPRNLKSRFWEMEHDKELIYAWVGLSLELTWAHYLKIWRTHVKMGTKPPEVEISLGTSEAEMTSEAQKNLAAIRDTLNRINRDGMKLVTMLQDPELDNDELQAILLAKTEDTEVQNER